MKKLSKEQMKNVMGGLLDGRYQCTFTYVNGTTYTYSYFGSGTQVQCAADHCCLGNDNCINADCAGSGAC